MLEKQLESKFRKAIMKIGGQAMKFVSPGMAGVPDRLVLLPGGYSCFVELKRPGGKLRPLQVHAIQCIQSLGFRVYVIDSEQDIQGFIADCLYTSRQSVYEKGFRRGYQNGVIEERIAQIHDKNWEDRQL